MTELIFVKNLERHYTTPKVHIQINRSVEVTGGLFGIMTLFAISPLKWIFEDSKRYDWKIMPEDSSRYIQQIENMCYWLYAENRQVFITIFINVSLFLGIKTFFIFTDGVYYFYFIIIFYNTTD